MGPTAPVRYHSLDALRGAMMLAGIYLHATVAYSRYGSWPWKDGSTTGLFDVSLGLIHVFRMPVFYCIAGFFGALLLEQRGAAGFLRNRAVRILLPFAVGWAVLFPLVAAIATTAMNLDDPAAIPGTYPHFYSSGEVLRHLDPMHLWFLEYLLIFYAIALAALPLARRLPGAVARIDRVFRSVLSSALGPLLLAAIVFPILCLTQQGTLEDPSGFGPEAKMLLSYLAFFAFGWLLYRNQAFPRLGRAAGFVAFGLAAALLGFYFIWRSEQPDSPQTLFWFFGSAWCLGLSMWLFTFGFTGMCFRLLERPQPWIRYVSDSSYWLYLAHMPVLLVFQIAVAGTGWPPVLKAFVVLAASVPALLASYHLFVRFTWIGVILNGRRHPIKTRPPLGTPVGSGWQN